MESGEQEKRPRTFTELLMRGRKPSWPQKEEANPAPSGKLPGNSPRKHIGEGTPIKERISRWERKSGKTGSLAKTGGVQSKKKSKNKEARTPGKQVAITRFLEHRKRTGELKLNDIDTQMDTPEGSWQPRNQGKHQLDQGDENQQTTGGQSVPLIGKRKSSLLNTTSSSKEIPCQEGGTGRDNEVTTSLMPQSREFAKGRPLEGRVKGSRGRCSKKMALAMEKWLQEARKLEPEATGPSRKPQEGGRKGPKETGNE